MPFRFDMLFHTIGVMAPDAASSPNVFRRNAMAVLIVAATVLGLFFLGLFVIAMIRRRRRAAEKRPQQERIADAWQASAERIEPFDHDKKQ